MYFTMKKYNIVSEVGLSTNGIRNSLNLHYDKIQLLVKILI